MLNQQVSHNLFVHGGHNKEIFMLTIRTFKLFCLKAGTEKAAQIHEYYIKMEEKNRELRLKMLPKGIISMILNKLNTGGFRTTCLF